MATVAVASPSFCKTAELRARLSAAVPEVRFNETQLTLTGTQLYGFFANCTAAIIGLEPVDRVLLEKCPSLKKISKYGVGMDNIDLKACELFGVAVKWTPGVNAYSAAEQTVGMMISSARNLSKNSELLKQGIWNKAGGFEIRGSTVGIIGAGRVGSEVCRILSALGAKILINDISDKSDLAKMYGAELTTQEQIFRRSNIVTLHVPLSEQTRNLVNESTLKLMRPQSILVNTSRGSVVDQKALKEALISERISAALDVYEEEPCKDVEFLRLKNLICTPHTCGNSHQAVMAMGDAAINNLLEMLGK